MKKLAEKVSMTVFMTVLALCLPACSKKDELSGTDTVKVDRLFHYECAGIVPFDIHMDDNWTKKDNEGHKVYTPDNCKITELK